MISEDEKTPAVVHVDVGPSLTPPPTLPRKRPPPGRLPGALSISEIVDRVTREVRERADADFERAQRALAAELTSEVRTATSLGIAAIALNVIVVFAVLAFARVLSGRLLGVVLAGLAIFFVALVSSLRSDLKGRLRHVPATSGRLSAAGADRAAAP